MADIFGRIKKNVKCCACEGSLENSRFVNQICLDKLATWEYPTWGNILVKDKYPEPRAAAILCDECIRRKRKPKYAVEWNKDFSQVRYHQVEDLKDLPEIREQDVMEAESKLNFFSGVISHSLSFSLTLFTQPLTIPSRV